jgi:hypothetical protein
MPDKSLRGASIGLKSLESDEGVEFAARIEVIYDCPDGHVTILPFSTEAATPPVWECFCGKTATLRESNSDYTIKEKKIRTHWDMLSERRTQEELEELLKAQIEDIKSGKILDE